MREQVAGDLLPAASDEERARQIVATSYLALGNTNLEEQDKVQLEMDVDDEQLDVLGQGLLAQTRTCARCHDHKFDPVPQRDYYALAGILRNVQALEHSNVSKWVEVPLPVPAAQAERLRVHDETVARLEERIAVLKRAVGPKKPDLAEGVLTPAELPGIVVDDRQAKKVGEWQE